MLDGFNFMHEAVVVPAVISQVAPPPVTLTCLVQSSQKSVTLLSKDAHVILQTDANLDQQETRFYEVISLCVRVYE